MPQLIVPDTVANYVSRFLRGVNICQGGGCCSMWLILSERYMEKNGQIWEWSGVEQWHLPFKLLFLLLWANDRLRGEGARWHHPPWYGSGVFLTFHYLRVTIISDRVKAFFPIPMDIGNLSNHVKSVCFSFLLSLIFTINRCMKINKVLEIIGNAYGIMAKSITNI